MTIRPNQRIAIEALAMGRTVEQTAIVAGVTERTVYNWRVEPEFKAELQRMTDSGIADATLFLSSCLMDAFRTMNTLCNESENEQTRLAAAKSIADSVFKVREQYEMTQRIAQLEELIKSIN